MVHYPLNLPYIPNAMPEKSHTLQQNPQDLKKKHHFPTTLTGKNFQISRKVGDQFENNL